jgi:hypothetical protein
MFNGTKGRLELEVVESVRITHLFPRCQPLTNQPTNSLTHPLTHTAQTHRLGKEAMTSTGGVHGTSPAPHVGPSRVSLHPLWEPSRALPIVVEHGSHGGGDTRMLNVLFGPRPGEAVDTGDASRQAATERDGTLALAVGLAANKSFGSGRMVKVAELALEG